MLSVVVPSTLSSTMVEVYSVLISEAVAFVVRNHCNDLFSGSYRRLFEKQGSVADNEELAQRFFTAATYTARQSDFCSIPGQPIAYWISEHMRQCFQEGTPLGEIAEPVKGMATGDNNRFLRCGKKCQLLRIGVGYPIVEMARAIADEDGSLTTKAVSFAGGTATTNGCQLGRMMGRRFRRFISRLLSIRNPAYYFQCCSHVD